MSQSKFQGMNAVESCVVDRYSRKASKGQGGGVLIWVNGISIKRTDFQQTLTNMLFVFCFFFLNCPLYPASSNIMYIFTDWSLGKYYTPGNSDNKQ